VNLPVRRQVDDVLLTYPEVFQPNGSDGQILRLPRVDHFGVFSAPSAVDAARNWLRNLR